MAGSAGGVAIRSSSAEPDVIVSVTAGGRRPSRASAMRSTLETGGMTP